MIRLILNGKKANNEPLRAAIMFLRTEGYPIEVRVTFEYGDTHRLVNEAITDGVTRLIVGGGDGSVNEVVDSLAQFPYSQRPELAILPLGTANDFATACQIPIDNLAALKLAVTGNVSIVDIAKANERHFINVATAGFGAQVTVDTPVELKNFLGGGAYTLVGVLQAINFEAYKSKIVTPDHELNISGIVGAICNGKQAGGGQILAQNAFINDGLFDVVIVLEFPISSLSQVLNEIQNPSAHNEYIKSFRTPWLESESKTVIPLNLDGEPYKNKKIRFEVVPNAIKLVLPAHCPCLK